MPSAQDPFYVVKEEIQESVSFALMGWGLNFFLLSEMSEFDSLLLKLYGLICYTP